MLCWEIFPAAKHLKLAHHQQHWLIKRAVFFYTRSEPAVEKMHHLLMAMASCHNYRTRLDTSSVLVSKSLRVSCSLRSLPNYFSPLNVKVRASLFPLQGERAHSLKNFVCTLHFKNKIVWRNRRRKLNNNRPINLSQGNNILHILHVHHLTINFIIHNKYISTIYLYIYIHTYLL